MGVESILVEYLGKPVWVAYLLYIFDIIFSAIAVWRTTQLKQPVWAVLLVVFRTAGILPILYLIFFSKKNKLRKVKNNS